MSRRRGSPGRPTLVEASQTITHDRCSLCHPALTTVFLWDTEHCRAWFLPPLDPTKPLSIPEARRLPTESPGIIIVPRHHCEIMSQLSPVVLTEMYAAAVQMTFAYSMLWGEIRMKFVARNPTTIGSKATTLFHLSMSILRTDERPHTPRTKPAVLCSSEELGLRYRPPANPKDFEEDDDLVD